MVDGIEPAGGSHDEALDRFAELWWDEGRVADAAAPAPSEPPRALVIRAERV
jgi:hypothetical protein